MTPVAKKEGAAALARRVHNVRKGLKNLRAQRVDPTTRAAKHAQLTRDLLVLHAQLSASAFGTKQNQALLQDVKTMLRVLDTRPGAKERREQDDQQRRLAERRRAMAGLQMTGPGSLPYERLDAGNKLDERGRVKTTDFDHRFGLDERAHGQWRPVGPRTTCVRARRVRRLPNALMY